VNHGWRCRQRGPLPRQNQAAISANSGLIIAARVVTACLSLATIPVLVSRLGVVGYGTWEALLALASLASLFQVAVSGTLVWRISEAYGIGDTQEIRRVARVGPVRLGRSLFCCGRCVVAAGPSRALLGVSAETRQLASEMFPVVAGLVLLSGLSQTLEAVVSGCQRTGLVNVVSAVAQILNYSSSSP